VMKDQEIEGAISDLEEEKAEYQGSQTREGFGEIASSVHFFVEQELQATFPHLRQ